jgi:hypothetical protein
MKQFSCGAVVPGCTARTVPAGSRPSSAPSGPPTTTTRAAPASSAASTGQCTMGRPHRSCRTFGVSDLIRVPCPAAITTAVKLTRRW